MIKKEEHKYPLVKVIWIDITADSNWKSLSELDKESLPVCVSNRPLSQGAIKIYTGSVVRVSGISDNEPPTLVLGPDKFEWQLLDQLLFPASR
jgi:hypothetical protein